MANRVTMGICGQDYTLVADENASYMEKVGKKLISPMIQFEVSLPSHKNGKQFVPFHVFLLFC